MFQGGVSKNRFALFLSDGPAEQRKAAYAKWKPEHRDRKVYKTREEAEARYKEIGSPPELRVSEFCSL